MSVDKFPVVGIGASAGGLEAFHAFFEHMVPDSGLAFIVILHLPPDRKSLLREIIERWTKMPVHEAGDGMRIEPNHVYVPPPHALVMVKEGVFAVQPAQQGVRLSNPIDEFFDSLGTDFGDRTVGIVLSGAGTDGALGLKAIKERGGVTMAQGADGSVPEYEAMPEGAISTGAVDIVAPVEEMPAHLLRIRDAPQSPATATDGDATDGDATDAARLQICALLRERIGHDFSDYRSQTFMRRVSRRMQVLNLGNLAQYVEALRSRPDELSLLFRDLLIRVTSFFRDSDTFEILAQRVIPGLFEGQGADGNVRVWVPGCATGEEAYSLAILLREHMATLQAVPKVQIFGTDIDESAIGIARQGRYPATLLEGLSAARLQKFFNFSHGTYAVAREVRDLCTFSPHNVVRDPPFSMMSMVSCRNLLIYMNPALQSRLLPVFHYALIPGGILLLGGSESVNQQATLFDTVDKAARIFRKRGERSPTLRLDWQRSQYLTAMRSFHATPVLPIPGGRQAIREGREPDRNFAPPQSFETRFPALVGHVEPNAHNITQLQDALLQITTELQTLTEEHQAALEELRSANEELHSVNEEMQSANEELETSKEELQSLNEEMHTVNLRLTEKVEELDQANSDLRNLFDSTEIATVFLDRHLVIRSFTPAISALFNLIPSDHGRPLTDIASRVRYDSLREDVEYVLASLEPLERRLESQTGTAHFIMRIVPYREPDSRVTGVLVTFVDVTSIVKAEEALVAADTRKDIFLATLSHELRNPLAPIRTAARLLQSPQLSPAELHHAQDVIARQVAHMGALLDDLLDISRITRAAFPLKKERVELRALMDDAVEAVQTVISAKSHTLRIEHPREPLVIEVDPLRMTQVLTNLLANAAKYTPPGGLIHMGAREEGQHLIIYVRDNGRGLSAEAAAMVFDMFTRIDGGGDGSEGGLGIGLALAKGVVELHGGELHVRSAGLGKGCEFQVLFPAAMVVRVSAGLARGAGEARAADRPRRLLLADDNHDSVTTLQMLLQIQGHEVHVAYTGEEALQAARTLRPEILVCDIGMPEMSGYEVARRIRAEEWGRDMVLVALTGWGQQPDRQRAADAGFDHHLTKPVDPEALMQLFGMTP